MIRPNSEICRIPGMPTTSDTVRPTSHNLITTSAYLAVYSNSHNAVDWLGLVPTSNSTTLSWVRHVLYVDSDLHLF